MNRSGNTITAWALVGAAALAAMSLVAPAAAQQQRSPAYAAARAAGQIGEKPDGYLGIVGAATPALRALVDDLNIKRRNNYTDNAKIARKTVEEFAVTQGCINIGERLEPGEKYMAPDGTWRTRTNEPPVRDPRCP